METILVFVIQAYDYETEQGRLQNVTTCELIDDDLDSAMRRAQSIVKEKKHYRLSKVIEKEVE